MDNFSFFQFIIEHLNYAWVWFLMLLESTVIPVPSELVVTPAAYFAHAGKDLNTWWVIVFATIGADCGATINYLAGYYLGRPLIYRFANSRLGRLKHGTTTHAKERKATIPHHESRGKLPSNGHPRYLPNGK